MNAGAPALDGAIPSGAPVLVAVSGGADSIALWDAVRMAGHPVQVWHLDHGLRAGSDVDAAFVSQRARRLDTAHTIEHEPIADRARAWGCGVEEAGRRWRYERLTAVAKTHGLAWVATAHHADDRAESILMHLLRGAGPAGWQGIDAQRELAPGITLVRPLLASRRADLRRWLIDRQQTWREDPTNADTRFTRNRVRRMLAEWEALAPGFAAHLLAVADRQSVEHRRLTAEADACLREALSGDALRVAPLDAAPPEVRTAALAVHLMMLGIAADRARLQRLCDLVVGQPGRRLVIGRTTWLRRADRVVWSRPAGQDGAGLWAAPRGPQSTTG